MPILSRANALYASTFLVTVCNAVIALALPWLVLQGTQSVITTGWVATLALGAVFAGSLLSRSMIDLVGARGVAILGFVGNIVGIAGMGYCFAQDDLPIPLLAVFVVVVRGFDAAALIAIESRMPEIARSGRVALSRLNATREGLVNAASILGAASAGLLLSVVDPLAVLGTAAAACAAAFAAFVPILGFYRPKGGKGRSPSMWTATKWILGQRHLRNTLLLLVVVMASVASLDDVLLPVFVDGTTGDPADIGYIFAAYSVAAIASALYYARHHDRIGESLLVRLGVAGLALFFAGLAVFEDIRVIIAVTFVTGLMSGALGPVIDTRFLADTPKAMRLGMLAATTTISNGVSPAMVFAHAWVIEVFSIQVLCLGAAAAMLSMLFLGTAPPADGG